MRHTFILKTVAACLLWTLSLTAIAATNHIERIVAFGDSLSDNGNIYELTSQQIPQDPPYYKGRFTNGPVWVELVATALHLDTNSKLQFSDRAYAGAWASDAEEDGVRPLIDFQWEVEEFLEQEPRNNIPQENTLYTVWVGSNDYLAGREKSSADAVTNNSIIGIQRGIETLIQHGAKNFLVFNLPNLGLTPSALEKGPDFAARLTMLAQLHNEKQASMLADLRRAHPEITLIQFDVPPYLADMVLNPNKYGITSTSTACYKGDFGPVLKTTDKQLHGAVTKQSLKDAYRSLPKGLAIEVPCNNPDNYIFWDHVHPTAMVHRWVSLFVLDKLEKIS